MFEEADLSRRWFVGAAAMTVVALASSKTTFGSGSELSALAHATTWLNSQPLTAAELNGKVILVEFWTYTCINWRRQLPYVRAWAEKYKEQLLVVGVHSPEFSFEKDLENVRRAVADIRIGFPVVLDSNHAVWRAFNNQYWPALYFVDAGGQIRHRQFGEGEYERSERVLQKLLGDARAGEIDKGTSEVNGTGAEAAADWQDLRSDENYLGYERTQRFVSPGGLAQDTPRQYNAPTHLRLNEWAISGSWTVGAEAVSLNREGGSINYRFHARDLHLVMGAPQGSPVPFRVLIDGHPPGAAHGVDVDEQGNGVVTVPRMYQLIRQPVPIVDRLFGIEFASPGVRAFSFTFG